MLSTPSSGRVGTWLKHAWSRGWLGEGLIGLIGSLTLAGWATGVPELKSVVPGLVPMNPLVAVTFVVAAVTLRLVRGDLSGSSATSRRRWAALGGAVLIVLVGGVTVMGYVLGRNLGIDQLLFGDDLMGNRIAPKTGLNFVVVGGALALLTGRFRRGPYIAQGLALASTFIALLAIVGYSYHASYRNGFTSYIPMAVNTAATFVVLSLGIIAAQPMGLMMLSRTDTIGGVVLRRFLPAAVLLPIVLGWLRLQGQRYGLYGTELGLTLFAVSNAAMFAALVLGLARTLRRMDLARMRTEEERDRYARGIAAHLHQELDRALRASLAPKAWDQRSEALARIQQVLTGDGLTMVFQPIIDMQGGAVVGVEALTRFSPEPRRPPDQWFAEAWTVDLGIELELAAVAAALAQLPSLPETAYLAVNVSPATILSGRFAAVLEGIPEARLVVEITEHAAVDDYAALTAALRDLRDRGVRLAVDDVGAGFSSLRHVTRLSPDLIKLDIALTRGIADDPVSQALAAALAGFARDAGIAVIAEGVENDAEASALRELGVGFGQGYHFARPGSLPLPAVVAPRPWQPPAAEDPAGREPTRSLLRRAVARADQRWNRDDGETNEGAPSDSPAMAGGRPFSWGAMSVLGALGIIVLWYIVGLPGGFVGKIVGNVFFWITMGLATVLCLRTGRRLRGDGGPWLWLGAAHGSWFAATLVWSYYDIWLRSPVPYPSLADVGYFGFYLFAFVGLLEISRQGKGGPSTTEAVLDALIVAVGVGWILFEALLAPLNRDAGRGAALMASVAWQAGTVGLVFLASGIVVWRADLLVWRPMPILILAIGLTSVANVLYGGAALTGSYAVGDLIDLGWNGSALLVGVAALVAKRVPSPHLPARP